MCTFSEFCLCTIVRFYVHIFRVLFMSDREVLCAHFQSFVYVRSCTFPEFCLCTIVRFYVHISRVLFPCIVTVCLVFSNRKTFLHDIAEFGVFVK